MRDQLLLFCVLAVVLPSVLIAGFSTSYAAFSQMRRARAEVRDDVMRMCDRLQMKAKTIDRFVRVVTFDKHLQSYAETSPEAILERVRLFGDINETLRVNMTGDIRDDVLYTALFFRDAKPIVSGISIGVDQLNQSQLFARLDRLFPDPHWSYRWMRASDLGVEGVAYGSGASDVLLVCTIVPVDTSNERIGYLVMNFRRDFITRLGSEDSTGSMLDYRLVDDKGHDMMALADEATIDMEAVLESERNGETWMTEGMLHAATVLPDTTVWHIVGSRDWIAVVRDTMGFAVLNLMVLLSLLMFMLWAALALVRRLADPLTEISAELPQIAAMQSIELDSRMLGREDEIGLIARSVQMLQREVQESFERIQKKNYELERFTYTVSHDLKSPLITIKGFAGSVLRDVSNGRVDRMESDLTRIRSAADKMQSLLDDLLELSRIGRIVNPSETIDMQTLVEEVLELLSGVIEARKAVIEIETTIPPSWGDRRRIMEVWQNLIENALKFAKPGQPPHVRIGARKQAESAKVEYYVRDEGIGVDPMHHEKIFGLFDKLNPETEGTGIGLALVRRIVEIHGGTLRMESALGIGSTFLFLLPERQVQE